MIMQCLLCGSKGLRSFHEMGDKGRFKLYRCQSCALVILDPENGIDQTQYAREFIDPKDDSHRVNREQTPSYRFLKRFLAPGQRILEIGCGNGRLLYLAQRDGMQVEGIELSPLLMQSVQKLLGITVSNVDFMQFDTRDKQHFDAVIMRHVLEHLPDPVKAMRAVFALLRPGGIALIEVPNIDSWELGA
ncbi:MAG: class I SAM-dependent methyltransferase, partial [Chitinivibrionales bacterium]|nr:class I SAM-dependent methyltransferase [Chitinivibrionales bacterium]